jgi:hypothetical protein
LEDSVACGGEGQEWKIADEILQTSAHIGDRINNPGSDTLEGLQLFAML